MAFKVANDTVASERSIISKNQGYKRFFCVPMNPHASMFCGLDVCGGRKPVPHTHGTTTVTLAVHAYRGLIRGYPYMVPRRNRSAALLAQQKCQ